MSHACVHGLFSQLFSCRSYGQQTRSHILCSPSKTPQLYSERNLTISRNSSRLSLGWMSYYQVSHNLQQTGVLKYISTRVRRCILHIFYLRPASLPSSTNNYALNLEEWLLANCGHRSSLHHSPAYVTLHGFVHLRSCTRSRLHCSIDSHSLAGIFLCVDHVPVTER